MLKNIKRLQTLLQLGEEYSPIFTATANGRRRHWWIGNATIHWCDQTHGEGRNSNIKKFLSRLWKERKEINANMEDWEFTRL